MQLRMLLGLAVLSLGLSSCTTMGTNAVQVDHNDKGLAKKLQGKSPQEAVAILGPAVLKGFEVNADGSPNLRTYQLVYAEAGQAPIYDWQLKMRVSSNKASNQDTGTKCISINFSQEDKYRFQDGGAAIYDNYDCIQFRNLSGEMPN